MAKETMRVTFVLPKYSREPIGGFRVVYEYANRLVRRGHEVTVVHPRHIHSESGRSLGDAARLMKSELWPHITRARNRPLIPWMRFDRRVRVELVGDVTQRRLPDADVIVATAWSTAAAVSACSAAKGVRWYLVHDYEFWKTGDAELRAKMAKTYQLGLRMIAPSPAVREMLAENGAAPAAEISDAVDWETHGLDRPIEERRHGTIAFPARAHPSKGLADAVAAVTALKAEFGDAIDVTAFGPAAEVATALPSFVRFVRLPSDAQLRALYNSVSIFLFPSHYEAFGLPGAEALACGAALACADSVGSRGYAQHEETALVVPIKCPDLLAAAVARLVRDDALRQRLARAGHARLRSSLTWDAATDQLERHFSMTTKPSGLA
jgi:glycosyltransferase involved in cell wall biosynthesis